MQHVLNFEPQDESLVDEQVMEAYTSCRANKRNTPSAQKFELELRQNLCAISDVLFKGHYIPGRSTAFIVTSPVKREIFAAVFSDRIVHHWLIERLNPLFEKQFLRDSYACRVGKGTHFGIRQVSHMLEHVSGKYSCEAYVLKLDIKGFFMNIRRDLLYNKLRSFVLARYQEPDRWRVLHVMEAIVMDDPSKNCIIRGSKKKWLGLPADKSLFTTPEGCGLPIGNLTSQVFANFYMDFFDHWVSERLLADGRGGRYGRYVDDFVVVHPDKRFLKQIKRSMQTFLGEELALKVHPKKVYLQRAEQGLTFLGADIRNRHVLPGKRIKGNFYHAITKLNRRMQMEGPTAALLADGLAVVNSYLGMLGNTSSERYCKQQNKRLSAPWQAHYHTWSEKKIWRKTAS
jgi:RNA-directed DNA polymerase